MISIVALYSRARCARSSRCFFLSFSRSAPTAAGEAGGAAVLRTARAANFGCFACASALASSRVTGPAPGAIFVVAFVARTLARALAGDAFLTFLRFTVRAICFPPYMRQGHSGRTLCLPQCFDPLGKQRVADDKAVALHALAYIFFERLIVEAWAALASQHEAATVRFQPDCLSLALAAFPERSPDHCAGQTIHSLRTIAAAASHYFSV